MNKDQLFLVRVWADGQGPRAAAREVESEDAALFDDPVALGCHLLGAAAPEVEAAALASGVGSALGSVEGTAR